MPFLSTLFVVLASLRAGLERAELGKDRKSALFGHRDVECRDFRIGDHVNAGLHDLCVLVQQVLIASSLVVKVGKVSAWVTELTPGSVDAICVTFEVGGAKCHSELACHVSLLDELVMAVRESTVISKLAVVVVQPKLAKLCLLFDLVGGHVGLFLALIKAVLL